jgi:hypothetical protein
MLLDPTDHAVSLPPSVAKAAGCLRCGDAGGQVRIYDRAITAAQITTAMNGAL